LVSKAGTRLCLFGFAKTQMILFMPKSGNRMPRENNQRRRPATISNPRISGRTRISYGESAPGWPGDVPQSRMDYSKLVKAGFSLPRSSDEAVKFAIDRIIRWLASRATSDDGLQLSADARPSSLSCKD
jgi:hypothetical protein